MENITEYFAHAQCVPGLSSGGGLGTRLLSFLFQGDVVQIFGIHSSFFKSSSVELLSN